MTTKSTPAPEVSTPQLVTDPAADGLIGCKVDPLANEVYSLESGPDSPPAITGPNTRVVQPTAPEGA